MGPQNRHELINVIRVNGMLETFEYCRDLIASVPLRLHLVIEKNRAMKKYRGTFNN
jgi:hypothetical protein